jgi:hypothetical protein
VTDKEQYLKELREIQEKLDRLTISVEWLVRHSLQQQKPFIPSYDPMNNICPQCGVDWSGVMAYYCNNTSCPKQLKVTSQTYNGGYPSEK